MSPAAPLPQPGLAIQATKLRKLYHRVEAVAGLDLEVPRGEVFGFLGRNGAGKTTTIKMLLGLARPTSGTATILGRPIGPAGSRVEVGYLPEMFRYPGWMRASELAHFHCRLARIPRGQWAAETERTLTLVGLATRQLDRVSTFSKGMQQRLGLGLALLGQPKLVLLDEPTSALDPVGRRDVRDIISALSQQGTTVFLNSHLLSEVERVCHRVAIVEAGSVIATGTLDQLLGGQGAVRIHLIDATSPQLELLRHAGAPTDSSDGIFVVPNSNDQATAGLVSKLVNAGAQIAAVEPIHRDLEERFLELVREAQA